MTTDSPNERLERLISRFLDDEATAGERRELNATIDREPAARALYEQTSALDREVGLAMRRALQRTLTQHPAAARRLHWPRLVGVAAAAALATILILREPGKPTGAGDGSAAQQASSWGFVPPAPSGDTFDATSDRIGLPHVQLRDTQRDWLVVPSERRGQFLIIEVQRVKTRAIGIHDDY